MVFESDGIRKGWKSFNNNFDAKSYKSYIEENSRCINASIYPRYNNVRSQNAGPVKACSWDVVYYLKEVA